MAEDKKEESLQEKQETAETPPDVSGEKARKKSKMTETYSVPMYVTVMFAVFIVLILLSYFISQRNSNQTISSMSTEHSKVQAQALENIEELQETNLALTEKVGEYEERISQLEKEMEDLQGELESAQADQKKYQAAQESLTQQEKKYAALHALFEYAQAIESGTDTEITSTSIKVEAQKDALDAEMRSYYEALKTAQQAG